VLWGTHGYGFHRVEPLFPVFLRPIGDFVRDYSLTHLLLDRRYATLEELRLPSDEVVEEIGDFILFRFDEGSDWLRNHKTEN
jgi:hypothetical protein